MGALKFPCAFVDGQDLPVNEPLWLVYLDQCPDGLLVRALDFPEFYRTMATIDNQSHVKVQIRAKEAELLVNKLWRRSK